jgi:hypothetical protein
MKEVLENEYTLLKEKKSEFHDEEIRVLSVVVFGAQAGAVFFHLSSFFAADFPKSATVPGEPSTLPWTLSSRGNSSRCHWQNNWFRQLQAAKSFLRAHAD